MAIDPKIKRSRTEMIRRAFTKRIADLGFARTKSTFWTRGCDHVVEVIHIHLFSFAPKFRVHLAIRVLNDEFDAVALNGPDSDDFRGPPHRYHFAFHANENTLQRCIDDLDRFCRDVGEPWFLRWRTADALIREPSPLKDRDRLALRMALEGRSDPARVAASRRMLGID